MFDIKAKIEEVVKKLKGSKSLMSQFNTEPIKVVEKIIGKDLPDEAVAQVVEGVKAKLGSEDSSNIISKIGGLFKKK